MPVKPKTPCQHPGCPELVAPGEKYCEKHKPFHPQEVRPAAKRGYGSKWQKARREYLAGHPLCVLCEREGRYRKATVVDHIIPHRGDQKLFWVCLVKPFSRFSACKIPYYQLREFRIFSRTILSGVCGFLSPAWL